MKSYCFSFGDSSLGPVGAVIRVKAENQESALAIARDALYQLDYGCDEETGVEGVEYLRVYFNAERLTLADLDGDEEEEIDTPEIVSEGYPAKLFAKPLSDEIDFCNRLVDDIMGPGPEGEKT